MTDSYIHKTHHKDDPSSAHHNGELIDTLGDSEVYPIPREPQKPDPNAGFMDYRVYRVADVIVGRDRKEIYNINTGNKKNWENLVQRQNVLYQGFEWVLRLGFVNRNPNPFTYTVTTQEGLVVREGSEKETTFGVGAAFKGLSVSYGGSRKTFSDREVSKVTEIFKGVTIQPYSAVYLYQKRYNFKGDIYFWQKVPNWVEHNHFGVAYNGGGRISTWVTTDIYAEEYISLTNELNGGQTTIDAEWAPVLPDEPYVYRQWTNITQKAKDTITGLGVNPNRPFSDHLHEGKEAVTS